MQNPEQPNAPTDFPEYPAYKPSGVKWLGDIPSHWDVPRLKYVCSRYAIYGANVPAIQYQKTGIRFIRTSDIDEYGELKEENGVFLPENLVRQYMLQDGDLLLSRSGTVGRSFLYQSEKHGPCAYAGYLVRFIPNPNFALPQYIYLFTRSPAFQSYVREVAVSTTIANVNARKYANAPLPLPPLPEQRAIAAYLDRKGDIARRYAHVARHIIDTLRELRQVEIHDAITRGLNEDIPLKPSGVEWLRDVPAHWDVCQVKRKYAIKLGKMLQNYPKRETDIAVPYLKVPNVQWAGVNAADAQTMYASPRDIEQYSIRKGDLLVCEGGEGGRCAILEEEPPPNCIIQNALHRVRPLRDDSNAYLKYTMNAIDTMGWFDAINNKATIAHFTVEKFSTLFIPNPPIAEQRAIAEYLDAKTAAIDAAIAHYERMAELVAEYWTVLVADAVTGRIDLRQTAAE